MTDGGGRKKGESAREGECDPLDAALGAAAQGPVTLTMRAPPLILPGESAGAEIAPPPPAQGGAGSPAHLDGWTLDRLRRSSLPPAMAQRAASAFPPPPRTPVPEAGDLSDDGGVLSLVGRSGLTLRHAADLVGDMADSFALGDFTGALRAAELLLGQEPGHDLAQHYERASRDKLEAIYTSRLLSSRSVPELAVPESELRWLGLDSHIAMVLARVDGRADIDAVIAQSGVPRLEALRGLVELLGAKVIRLV